MLLLVNDITGLPLQDQDIVQTAAGEKAMVVDFEERTGRVKVLYADGDVAKIFPYLLHTHWEQVH